MSEPYEPDSAITHHCKGCVFAVKEGRVQTGCSAGRLEVLRARPGVSVVEVRDPPGTPDPSEFYVLDGSWCFYKRLPPWEGTPADARREMRDRMTFHLFVVAGDPDLESVRRTVGAGEGFDRVGVIRGENPPPRADLVSWLRDSGLRWTLDWPGSAGVGWPELLDDAVRSTRCVWYVLAHAGAELPPDLVGRVKAEAIDRDRAFLALIGRGWYAMQTRIHREIGGNAPSELVGGSSRADSVLDKLRHVERDKGERYVFDVDEILGVAT